MTWPRRTTLRRAVGLLALVCSWLPCAALVAAAQDAPPPARPAPADDGSVSALSPDQERELHAWLTAMEKWQRYDARWYNRPARDSLGRITAHQPPPDPPAWLDAHCAAATSHGIIDLEPRTAIACRLAANPRTPMPAVPTGTQARRLDAEKSAPHTSFLTRVHLDGLWTMASTGGRIYGLIGSHISLVDVGRLQVFGPPGVLLVSVPDGDSRRLSLGYTWGVSLRLVDVRLFGRDKDTTLFMNVSKVWIASGTDHGGARRGYDMLGFSIAPRKKR